MAGGIDLDDALRRLYSVGPDDFMAVRAELTETLRSAGDADGARDVSKRRKPTLAAWLVNALVLDDGTVLERVTAVGDELRAAQHALDAPTLRALSGRRRTLVAELTDQACRLGGRADAAVGLRDEVSGTLDAAVADPDVAARLGQLQKAERFAGFGFGDLGGDGAPPQLRLVRGGRHDDGDGDGDGAERAKRGAKGSRHEDATADEKPAKQAPRITAAERRKRERALRFARDAAHLAEHAGDEAQQRERDARDSLRSAEAELSAAKKAVDAAKRELDDARGAVKQAKADRRETRRALDRAEREHDADA